MPGGHAGAAEAYVVAGERARALYAYAEALEHYALGARARPPRPGGAARARSATCTRCAASTAPRSPPTRPPPRSARATGSPASSTRSAGSTTGAASGISPSATSRPRSSSAASGARVARRPQPHARHRGAAGDALDARRRARSSSPRAPAIAEALAQAHNIVGMLLDDRGHLERSLALAEALPDPSVAVAALNNLALACARAGDGERALELTARALELCSRAGRPPPRGGAAQQPRRPAAPRGAVGRGDGAPQAGGRRLRRDRRRRRRDAARGLDARRVVSARSQSARGLIQTDAWAGCTVRAAVSRSSRIVSRSTATWRRAANAAIVSSES